MNQEYRGRVDRFLKAGGDPKYVNVKRKSEARHSGSKSKAIAKKKETIKEYQKRHFADLAKHETN